MLGGPKARWYVLRIRHHQERVVLDQLGNRVCEAYLPVCAVRRRWSDRIKTSDLPLFPTYLFARFPFEERSRVLAMPGVTSLVSFGGKPAPLEDEEIERVKAMVCSGLPVMPWPFLNIGQRVRIRGGALSGLEGVLAREKAQHWVVVNMDLLQRAVAVEIERDLLTPITLAA